MISRVALCRGSFLAVLLGSTMVSSASAVEMMIINPIMDQDYETTANIDTYGSSDLGEGKQVVIKIFRGTSIQAEKVVCTDISGDWTHDFPAPTGGWTAGDDYSCKVYRLAVEYDSMPFTVGQGGPPP